MYIYQTLFKRFQIHVGLIWSNVTQLFLVYFFLVMKYVYVYGNILGAAGQIIMYLLVLCIKWIVLFPTLSQANSVLGFRCWKKIISNTYYATFTYYRSYYLIQFNLTQIKLSCYQLNKFAKIWGKLRFVLT